MFGFRLGRRLAGSEKTYDFPPFRPPSEAGSLLLRLTRGCPWNRCAFCPMYRETTFELRSVAEVKQDIEAARDLMRADVDTVFIGDSDSLLMEASAFCEILGHVYGAFPNVSRVTSYARALTLRRKPLKTLERLRAAGLTRLHVGLETGHRQLLKKIKKGATPETMVDGCTKAKAAGFEVSVYVLAGIGGDRMWREHATETAHVLNAIAPHFIRVRTLTPQPGTPIYRWLEQGLFHMATPETILKEQMRLIERLSIKTQYLSDHVSNYASINGHLPEDRETMIGQLEQTLHRLSADDTFRQELENMRYLRRL